MRKTIQKLTIIALLAGLSLAVSACLKKPAVSTNQQVNISQIINTNQNMVNQDENTSRPAIIKEVDVNTKEEISGVPFEILNILKQNYLNLFSYFKIKKGKIFWRRDNGSRMVLYDANILADSVIDFSQIPKDKLSDKFKELAEYNSFDQSKINDLKYFFEQQGFILNKSNTNDELVYGNIYDHYLSFSKDGLKCTIYWTDKSSYPTSDFVGCAQYTDNDEKIYQEFKSLFSDGNAYWSVDKYDDNFAIGNYSPASGGGSNWYAKKVENNWQIFLNTQEDPYCSILKKNSIPDTFYIGECWQDDGKTKVFYSN